MKCSLKSGTICPGDREAELFIRWRLSFDPHPAIAESVVCRPCFDGRPDFVVIVEQRPVQEGDTTSV